MWTGVSQAVIPGYCLDYKDSFAGRGRCFSLCRRVQAGSGAHPVTRPVGYFAGVVHPEREADHSLPPNWN
jgi:hypothetical protein